MSDIDLSGLDWIFDAFIAASLLGPPVVIGLLFLLLGNVVHLNRRVSITLYFVVCVGVGLGVSLWLSDWLSDVDTVLLGVAMSFGSAGLVLGIYALGRWLVGRASAKKPV